MRTIIDMIIMGDRYLLLKTNPIENILIFLLEIKAEKQRKKRMVLSNCCSIYLYNIIIMN
jgi:hypothetical protein